MRPGAALAAALAAACAAPPSHDPPAAEPGALLVTNEYATANPGAPGARVDAIWEATSGSLFMKGGTFWTGVPDGRAPGAASASADDSAVLRLRSRTMYPEDVSVTFSLRTLGLTTTPRTPARPWDGVHVWLRYASPESLYAVSVNRRDGTVVIKKKVPGGPSYGGTYATLASAPYAVPYGAWQEVRADARTVGRGVRLSLWVDGALRVEALDDGAKDGPAHMGPGRVGLRGDNCEFEFKDWTVTSGAP